MSLAATTFIKCFVGPYTAELCCSNKYGTGGNQACWYQQFTYDHCCLPLVENAEEIRGNPACWRRDYNFRSCCWPGDGFVDGVSCWDENFTHDRCCVEKQEGRSVGGRIESTASIVFWDRMALVDRFGTAPCPKRFWQEVLEETTTYLASQANGSPPDGNRDYINAKLVIRIYSDQNRWNLMLEMCLIGMINLVELTLIEIGSIWSYERTRELYKSTWKPVNMDDYKNTAWVNLRLQHPERAQIMGFEQHKCPPHAKVYVYPYEKLTDSTIPCSNRMPQCAGSVYILQYLMTASRGPDSCITDDPAEADLFLFPNYEACYNSTICTTKQSEWCYPPNFSPAALPYFDRRQGMDHVFLAMCNLSPFMHSLTQETRQSIYVTTESYQNNPYTAWFSFWKDVMMPGYIPFWRLLSMRMHNQPTEKRNITIGFHAHTRRTQAAYKTSVMSMVRDQIVDELHTFPDVSVSVGYVISYFIRMGKSVFCLVVAGLTAWSIHLYESFFFGCIPVILSDELTMPFQDIVDWPSLSIKVPRSTNLTELYYRLKAIPVKKRKAMKASLEHYSCWFVYSNWENECSPLTAMMRYLGKKSRELQSVGDPYTRTPRFWN